MSRTSVYRIVVAGALLGGAWLVHVSGITPAVPAASRGIVFVVVLSAIVGIIAAAQRAGRLHETALALLVSIYGLVVIDWLMRPIAPKLLFTRPDQAFAHRWPKWPDLGRYDANVSFLGTTSGDLADFLGDPRYREPAAYTFITDAHGFRNATASPDRPVDLVVLGDSFAAGLRTTQEKTWSALLAASTGLRVENLGFPTSPWHELVNLKLEVPRMRLNNGARLVWVLFSGNDLDESYGDVERTLEPPAPLPAAEQRLLSNEIFRNRSPFRMLMSRVLPSVYPPIRTGTTPADVLVRQVKLGDTSTDVLFFRPYDERMRRPSRELGNHPNATHLRRIISEGARFARRSGLSPHVVLLPAKEETYAWVLDGLGAPPPSYVGSSTSVMIRDLVCQSGVPVLDLGPALFAAAQERYRQQQLIWWRDDTHLNEAGHAVVAQALTQALSKGTLGGASGFSACPQPVDTQAPDSAGVALFQPDRQTFASLSELRLYFEAHEHKEDGSRLEGWLDIVRTDRAGEAVVVGWTVDLTAPERESSILIFGRGRLIGSGKTSEVRKDVVDHFARGGGSLPAGFGQHSGFSVTVPAASCRELVGDELWGVAVTQDRRYRVLQRPPQLTCTP